MFVVTNQLKIKKGFAKRMAPMFTRPGALQKMEGFHKVEVLVREDSEEYDECRVNMYWETLENFEAWKTSDAFKEAHRRPEPNPQEEQQESPILGSELIISEIASVLSVD